MELTELQKAYLAGCMDSDGCFSIGLKEWKGYSQLVPRVSFWQISPEVINLFQSAFGGSIRKVEKPTPWRDIYAWEVSHKKAAFLCETLLPYLIIKAEQARTLLALQETKDYRYSGGGVPSDVLCYRQELRDKMRQLNKRGKKNETR